VRIVRTPLIQNIDLLLVTNCWSRWGIKSAVVIISSTLSDLNERSNLLAYQPGVSVIFMVSCRIRRTAWISALDGSLSGAEGKISCLCLLESDVHTDRCINLCIVSRRSLLQFRVGWTLTWQLARIITKSKLLLIILSSHDENKVYSLHILQISVYLSKAFYTHRAEEIFTFHLAGNWRHRNYQQIQVITEQKKHVHSLVERAVRDQFGSVLYYWHAERTASRPVTDAAQEKD
jgi:hypothetical protein